MAPRFDQGSIVFEPILDEVGRDAIEERTLNLVRPEQMRRATIGGLGLDDGDYLASVGLCAELLDMPAVRAHRQRGD